MFDKIAIIQQVVTAYNNLPAFGTAEQIHKAVEDIPEWVRSLPNGSEKIQIRAWATIIKSAYVVWFKDIPKNQITYSILNVIKYAGAVYFSEIKNTRSVSPETIISASISAIILLVEKMLKQNENEANNV